MHTKITDSIYSVGILNPNLRIFDIVMKTDYGTSYNSYIVKGSEKTALIDCNHKTYFKQYIENIKEICPLEEIDYIVLNHNEPDHSGTLGELLALMPQVQVVASKVGALYIKNIANRDDIQFIIAKDNDEISLGDKMLKFINAPFLHWPDSMFTWVPEEKTLFTCDFFGCHFCEPSAFDYNIVYGSYYEKALKAYYDAIFGPFGSHVKKGLEKIKELDMEFICTSHGPVLTKRGRWQEVLAKYEEWSAPIKNDKPLIPIFYCTAYGNTGLLAESIRDGILETIDADCEIYDLVDYDMEAMQWKLNTCDAFVIGSPTINKNAVPPIWNLLAGIDMINSMKKSCAVFGSYGWSGEAVPNLCQFLTTLKLNVFEESLKVTFVPSDQDLEKAKELGRAFAQSL